MELNEKFISIIESTNESFIQNELRPFLRIPSNTGNEEGIHEAKDFIRYYLSDVCDDLKVYEGKVNPLMIATVKGHLEQSLLIDTMYYTQPVHREQ